MLKNILKNRSFIRNSLIIFLVTTILLATDLLLKHYLYDANFEPQPGAEWQWNIKVLAGRSLLHTSTTFLDFIGGSIPRWAGLLISFTIVALFVTMGLFAKNKVAVIGIGIALAGIFGNTMDTIMHGGVRDIFYLPFWDNGTFNFADVIVVIGAVMTGISFLVTAFKTPSKPKKVKISQSENKTKIDENLKNKKYSELEEAKLKEIESKESILEDAKLESAKLETPKLESAKLELPQLESAKLETPKLETPKLETPKLGKLE